MYEFDFKSRCNGGEKKRLGGLENITIVIKDGGDIPCVEHEMIRTFRRCFSGVFCGSGLDTIYHKFDVRVL